jgi:ubiquitin carboxyl-terminal hydrolase 8
MKDKNITNFKYDFHKNHEIALPLSFYQKKGLCGLINIGNTCFLNSTIQCLSHTLKLTDYFLSRKFLDDNDENNKRKKEYKLLNSYINLLINMWETNQLIKPKSFLESLSTQIVKYSRLQQQDSHECLMYILDNIHKALSYEIEVCISGNPKNKSDKLIKQSLESWKSFYENDFSYIIELFTGMVYNKITCLSEKCEFEENIFEPYNCLSLDIPFSNSDVTVDIHTCLEKHFQDNEKIKSWKCEKCKLNGCNKKSNLWSLPDNLIIQLKRFNNEGSNKLNKISKQVQFPIDDLNLTKYISQDKNDPNNYIYSLYAVNYHSGSLNSGHYWSCCKNLDDSWYLFNDGHVTKFNPENDVLYKDAYLLFYYRKFIKK